MSLEVLAEKLVPIADGPFNKASEMGTVEQLWSGAVQEFFGLVLYKQM